MSGGYFDYAQHRLTEMADQVAEAAQALARYDLGEHEAEIRGCFEETETQLRRAYWMAQAVDYLLSWDHGPESFLKVWKEAAK